MTKKQKSIEGAKEKQRKKEPKGKEKHCLPRESPPLQIAKIRQLDKEEERNAYSIIVRKKQEIIPQKGV